jgi:hypothetical protein
VSTEIRRRRVISKHRIWDGFQAVIFGLISRWLPSDHVGTSIHEPAFCFSHTAVREGPRPEVHGSPSEIAKTIPRQ